MADVKDQADIHRVMLTEAMVSAGIGAYFMLDREYDNSERIVTEIFQAMIAAAQKPSPSIS